MPRIDAVIFDMDGLLIDTEPIWWRAEMECFGAVGLHLTEADCMETMGVRIAEVVERRYRQQPWTGPSREELTRQIEDVVIDHVKTEGEPNPGVPAAMQLAHEQGLPIAIASSSSLRLIEAVVERLEIGRYVRIMCSADDELEGKPHPGVYLTAAWKLGVRPNRCLAFEDSPNGVLSAQAAGMFCVAVPDHRVADDPRIRRADLIIDSLVEFTPELLDHIRGSQPASRPA